jgi:hypothetical protein
VSRSAAATKDASGLSRAWFQAELLRVTDPRSNRITRLGKTTPLAILSHDSSQVPSSLVGTTGTFRSTPSMSNRSSRRRSSHLPPIPVVTPETWKKLFPTAEAFGLLAPWTWMHDSELLGLRHPVTGEKLLCSILGRMRTMFALLVYRHDAGIRWVLNTIQNDGDSGGLEDPDSGFEQDCVKVEYVPKSDLTKEDRATLTAASFAPSAKKGGSWPAFRSLVPGGYPWYLAQVEAETLLYALPRVGAFASLVRDDPEFGVDLRTGEVPFFPDDWDPVRRPLRAEALDWQPLITPPEPSPIRVSLDDAMLARLLKLPQAKGFHLEIDVFYSPFLVGDGERPYFPKGVMATDRTSGFIGGLRLAPFTDRDAAVTLAEVLVQTLEQLGNRPETIRVQRPCVALMLSSAAERLKIPVWEDAELPALNDARNELEQGIGN